MSDRASKFTISNKTVERYSDFLVNFDMNPLTGFLARNTNEDSISQSLRNLILTERTERPYQAKIGSKIWSLLFEPIDDVTTVLLKMTIGETIRNNEKRVKDFKVIVTPNVDLQAYFISIAYSPINNPSEVFQVDTILRRAR